MTDPGLEIQAIAVVAAMACAVPGTFLVLRRMTMLTDAISHAILPGIVVGYLLQGQLASPWLLAGAAFAGVITVWLVEMLFQSGNLRQDAAIGVVFPALFALGVVLIARYAANVHLDVDAVLMGELAFAPFDRLAIGGRDVGPRALWTMLAVLALNVALVAALYKELKAAAFDDGTAAVMGLRPGALHYLLMSCVSLTAVAAFDAVGSVLVVALFAGPPAAAYMLTNRLAAILVAGPALGAVASLAGYRLAGYFDVSIAGAIATAMGLLFALVVVMAPDKGLVSVWLRRRSGRQAQRLSLLLVHLSHHQEQPGDVEARVETLGEHLSWSDRDTVETVATAVRLGLAERADGVLTLTDEGRRAAERQLVR